MNEALGKKDLVMGAKVFRKEAKESRYWLKLTGMAKMLKNKGSYLFRKLMKIFSAILEKTK